MFKKILSISSPLFLLACSASAVQTERPLTARPLTTAGGQIYTYESDAMGFNTKNYFYDNGEEVVAFDTQFTPALAQASIDYLRTKTQNPITFVVLTHPNPDKFNGLAVFQAAGAKVIASQATAEAMGGAHEYKKYYFVNITKMFAEDAYPKLGAPDSTFESQRVISLRNGATVELSELAAPGVSSNQTVAYIPGVNALIVGDLVHHRAHAWLEGGIVDGKPTPTLAGWITDLEALSARYGAKNPLVLGGRGGAAALNEAVRDQIAYLRRADAIVSAYVADLKDPKAELTGDGAGAHHAAILQKMEQAFPDYKLGYLIQYGVYGLANSKL